ncbi:MAG: DUF2096 family protein [Candidatus Bathyarchaeota archaeon]|nr:DUF2096 family protein [Candidatus Bathyarchaeota archaeon]
MNWELRWRILSDVTTDLLRGGVMVPPNIINDLRSAKVILEILKVDRSQPENISRLEDCLSNVEVYVLTAARGKFGEKYVENILRRLYSMEVEKSGEEMRLFFHPGLPRDEKWIRVKITDETPLEVLESIAGELGLKLEAESGRYVLVHGGEKELKDFVRRVSEKIHGSKKK